MGGIRDPRPPGALCLTGKGSLPVEEAVNPNETALEVAWIASRSPPLRSLASSLVPRAMEALAKEPDVADVGLTPVPLGRAREPAEASTALLMILKACPPLQSAAPRWRCAGNAKPPPRFPIRRDLLPYSIYRN